jgi:hypothetical protein
VLLSLSHSRGEREWEGEREEGGREREAEREKPIAVVDRDKQRGREGGREGGMDGWMDGWREGESVRENLIAIVNTDDVGHLDVAMRNSARMHTPILRLF